MAVFERISARRSNQVNLDVTFFQAGSPADPYAIRKVEIYKTSVAPHNKVAEFTFPSPCDDTGGYPLPAEKVTEDVADGVCGTEGTDGAEVAGKYRIVWDIPDDAKAPDIYFDVWSFMPTNPCLLDDFASSTECETLTDGTLCHSDLDSEDLECLLVKCCHRFWVYPDDWECYDDLQSMRLGFEPLDQKFKSPEKRPLEVGITPLPLYDNNFNLNQPRIPFLQGTIRIETASREVLVNDAPMEMGLRQGRYRSNPFVFRYWLDTSDFVLGTYKYRITATLPDGTTRTSDDFMLSII